MSVNSDRPNDDLIDVVMRECDCTEERAISLLQNHHDLFRSYIQVPVQSPSPPPISRRSVSRRRDDIFATPLLLSLSSKSSTRWNTPPSNDVSPDAEPDQDLPWNTNSENDDVNLEAEWDFVLPVLPSPGVILDDDEFSPESLARAIQHGAKVYYIQRYLSLYCAKSVEKDINGSIMGFPPIFYAVAANCEQMARLLIQFGADVGAVHAPSRIPLLAFAIICGETLQTDTTTMVCTLLSQGASPLTIPADLFFPYIQKPMEIPMQKDQEIDADTPSAWCSPVARAKLAKSINLTHRYFLERAMKMKRPSLKRRQIAQRKNAEGLLGVPYFLVGQAVATELLIQRLLTHLMMPTKQPLVLCFAGPSGHGKTELARQLGNLLSLDLEVVDCTVVNHEMELFGPRPPYREYERGSAVNNFLAGNSGKRCIVFMDEFEKTTKEIHQSLLLPFDNGEYRDRRNGDKIDCSNTIWILATNALDSTILDFYQQNDAIAGDDEAERSRLVRKLSQQLQENFLQQFGAPVTGRISDFIPFLPFSAGEQAVITHKCLLELARDLRIPVNLSKGRHERLVGGIRLSIRKDGDVCTMLAQAHYHNHLGARSLKAGAQKVKRLVLDAYLDDDEEIRERDDLSEFVIDVESEDIVGRAVKDR